MYTSYVRDRNIHSLRLCQLFQRSYSYNNICIYIHIKSLIMSMSLVQLAYSGKLERIVICDRSGKWSYVTSHLTVRNGSHV